MEEVVIDVAYELGAAITHGYADPAAKAAEKLADSKEKISLEIGNSAFSPTDKWISINVCIEDRYSADTCLPIRISPSMTFQQLSCMIFERFEFPIQVQQWIVQKRKKVHNLDTKIEQWGVSDGDTLHLYLLPASSVHVTQNSAEHVYMMAASAGSRQISRDIPSLNRDRPDSTVERTPAKDDIPPKIKETETNAVFRNDRLVSVVPELDVGWSCPKCTLRNLPTRPSCAACLERRPDDYLPPADYVPPEDEQFRLANEQQFYDELKKEREANREQLMSAEQQPLVTNTEPFECKICFDQVETGQGVVLRDCLHVFCRDCLRSQIEASESAAVVCPFDDGNYSCESVLQEREIKALVSEEAFTRFLTLGIQEAESRESRSFHCRTPDCRGWCVYEDDVNTFECEICKTANCLTCKVQHVGQTCQQYQESLKSRATVDKAARQTQKKIQKMLRKGDAMHCPTCQIIVIKKDGCDWMRCSMCKTEICWVTKGPRWGPAGEGDTSGGCRCGVDGKLCHPKCNNCH